MNEYKLKEDEESGATDMNESAIKCQDNDDLYEGIGVSPNEYEQIVHLSAQVNEDTFFSQLICSEL